LMDDGMMGMIMMMIKSTLLSFTMLSAQIIVSRRRLFPINFPPLKCRVVVAGLVKVCPFWQVFASIYLKAAN
ncbi:MAG: hypothetical protein ACRDEA_16805, partial [Microcystaceae cyanobacterium]